MMRAQTPHLAQTEQRGPGRHRALPAVYVRTNADDLTGHRRAVTQLPVRVRRAIPIDPEARP